MCSITECKKLPVVCFAIHLTVLQSDNNETQNLISYIKGKLRQMVETAQ
jgi:hypothetical protein